MMTASALAARAVSGAGACARRMPAPRQGGGSSEGTTGGPERFMGVRGGSEAARSSTESTTRAANFCAAVVPGRLVPFNASPGCGTGGTRCSMLPSRRFHRCSRRRSGRPLEVQGWRGPDRAHRHRAPPIAGLVPTAGAIGPKACWRQRAHAHTIVAWILSIAAGLGIVVGSVFLMPAVAALVRSFRRRYRARGGRTHYPRAGRHSCRFARAAIEGTKTARSRSWSISSRCRSCCSPVSAP